MPGANTGSWNFFQQLEYNKYTKTYQSFFFLERKWEKELKL